MRMPVLMLHNSRAKPKETTFPTTLDFVNGLEPGPWLQPPTE